MPFWSLHFSCQSHSSQQSGAVGTSFETYSASKLDSADLDLAVTVNHSKYTGKIEMTDTPLSTSSRDVI